MDQEGGACRTPSSIQALATIKTNLSDPLRSGEGPWREIRIHAATGKNRFHFVECLMIRILRVNAIRRGRGEIPDKIPFL
jgi:hypothetical protein